MRLRTRIIPLSSRSNQPLVPLLVTVDSWMAELQLYVKDPSGLSWNGLDVFQLMPTDPVSLNQPLRLRLGGMVVGGMPVMINEQWTFVFAGGDVSGSLVLTYFDKA